MKTIYTYPTLIDAQLMKAKLDSAGINSFIPDENTITLVWLYSNALGGTRLQVDEEDFDKAKEILAEIDDSNDDYIMKCPKCNSHDIVHLRLSLLSFITYFIGFFIPVISKKVFCNRCKTYFK